MQQSSVYPYVQNKQKSTYKTSHLDNTSASQNSNKKQKTSQTIFSKIKSIFCRPEEAVEDNREKQHIVNFGNKFDIRIIYLYNKKYQKAAVSLGNRKQINFIPANVDNSRFSDRSDLSNSNPLKKTIKIITTKDVQNKIHFQSKDLSYYQNMLNFNKEIKQLKHKFEKYEIKISFDQDIQECMFQILETTFKILQELKHLTTVKKFLIILNSNQDITKDIQKICHKINKQAIYDTQDYHNAIKSFNEATVCYE